MYMTPNEIVKRKKLLKVSAFIIYSKRVVLGGNLTLFWGEQ